MPRLITDFEKGRIVAYFELGWKLERIARMLKHSRQSISQVVNGLARRPDAVKREKKRGRNLPPRKKAIAQRRVTLVILAQKIDRSKGLVEPKFGSAKQIALEFQRLTAKTISDQTVRRDLHAKGLGYYVRPLRTFDTVKAHQARKAFVRVMLSSSYGELYFKRIVFSDEHYVDANHHGNRGMWVMYRGLALKRLRKSRYNVPNIMIWAGIGFNYKTPIVFLDLGKDEDGKTKRMCADNYVRLCLAPLVPDLRRRQRVFMQDGARIHTAKKVLEYLERERVTMLPSWPAYSPDMNPIESVWSHLNTLVYKLGAVANVAELKEHIVQAWDSIPMETINNFAGMFATRLREVSREKHEE